MTVLVTRPRPPGANAATRDPLVAALEERGVKVVHVPTVAIEPADREPLVSALRRSPAPEWVVVTSANGAAPVAAAAQLAGGLGPETRVAAVGPQTAAALQAAGVRVDHVPPTYLTLAIAAGLGEVRGRRVVLARADAATPDLREALQAMGALVEEVVAYRTIEGPPSAVEALLAAVGGSRLRVIAFTSGSTVRGLGRLLLDHPEAAHTARHATAACIGPVTAAEATRLGFAAPLVPSTYTAAALAATIATHLDQERVA